MYTIKTRSMDMISGVNQIVLYSIGSQVSKQERVLDNVIPDIVINQNNNYFNNFNAGNKSNIRKKINSSVSMLI